MLKLDFMKLIFLHMEKINSDEWEEISDKFDDLDETGDGVITQADFRGLKPRKKK